MFLQSSNHRSTASPGHESAQPLLRVRSHSPDTAETIFSVEDSDFGHNASVGKNLDTASRSKGHTVRFEDSVHVIAPPLRSTQASRETEYELDPDDLGDECLERRDGGQSMPLLLGLLDSAAARRSLDSSIPLSSSSNGRAAVADDSLDLAEIAAKRTAGGGMFNSIANMANSILGAGIIGLPYSFRQAGFLTGLVLLLSLCIVTDWTIRLIIISAKLSGGHSYIDIMHHCFGSSGRAAVSFFQFSFAFGGMCAFGIIIGDTLPQIMRTLFPNLASIPVLKLLTNRQFVIALCTICISYPLSLYRDIHKLARASGLALFGMVIIVISVVVEGPKVPPEFKGDPAHKWSVFGSGIFQAIGVISFAFVCHHNSLLIYGSLRTPTLDRFARVTHASTTISFISCTTLAVAGYVTFTDKTQGNILNNFPKDDLLINISRFAFGMNMFTTLPLELFVCREVIEQFFFSHETFSMQRHVFFTTVILFASMFVSLITCDLGVMLEITGGISATALAYIFPAACYFKLTDKRLPWHHRTKFPALACVAFGIVVMVISLALALGKMWTIEGAAKICA